ncbi:MAG TPA: hypothetical protein VII55_02925 [Candidatus Saccharimonadales bacterium]
MGRQEQIEPSYSKARFRFPPFWLEFTEIVLPDLDYALRDGRKVLSPDLVIFHPAQRGLVGGISKAINSLSQSNTDAYGRLRSVPSVATPSMGVNSLAIPCLTFFTTLPPEEAATVSRQLVEASADAFTETGLVLPTDALPRILMTELELQGRSPVRA